MYITIWSIVLIFVILILLPLIGLNVLFLVLGAALAFVIIMRNKELKKNIYKKPVDELHITNVDKGGVFKLTGVGDDSEELTLKVITKHLYQQGDFFWYELECDKGDGEKIWVEVEDDDETVVSIALKRLKLADISTTEAKLAHIDDEESGNVRYSGKTFMYEDSDEAIFYKFCDNKRPEKLYYWDFVSGDYTISVEKWSDNDYQVFYCQNMRPSQVTVYSNNAQKEGEE